MNGHAIHTRQQVGSERFGESSLFSLHLDLFLQELSLFLICRGTDVGIVDDWVILTGGKLEVTWCTRYLVGQDAFAPKAERVSVIRDETFASWAERWSECLAPSLLSDSRPIDLV